MAIKYSNIMKNIVVSVVLLLVGSITIPSSAQWGWSGIKGEGAIVSKKMNLSSIEGIALSISGTVHLKQGSTQSIEIKAQQNIINNIKTEVKGNIWEIGFKENVRDHEPIHIYITLSKLSKIAITGSGDVLGESKFSNMEALKLSISGSGDISLDAASKQVDASITGSGNIAIKGTTEQYRLSIAGSGDFNAFGLTSNTATVQITGSGNGSVNVQNTLEVSITGSGDVYYKGNPRLQSRIVGSGEVQARN
jgi:hypothetical protein